MLIFYADLSGTNRSFEAVLSTEYVEPPRTTSLNDSFTNQTDFFFFKSAYRPVRNQVGLKIQFYQNVWNLYNVNNLDDIKNP